MSLPLRSVFPGLRAPLAFAVLVTALGAQGSDVRLVGPRLERWLRSKGTSEIGRTVQWTVPAKTFGKPARRRRQHALYVHKGIGIVVPAGLRDLEEIRRRGGYASVRGRVFRVPAAGRKKDDPAIAVSVREMRQRRRPPRPPKD